jgi:hypothetical protein
MRLSVQRVPDTGEACEHLGTGLLVTADTVLLKPPVRDELRRPGSPADRLQVVTGPVDPRPGTVLTTPVAEIHVADEALGLVVLKLRTSHEGNERRLLATEHTEAIEAEVPTDEAIAAWLDQIPEPSAGWRTAAAEATRPDLPGSITIVLPDDGASSIRKWLCKKFPDLFECKNVNV